MRLVAADEQRLWKAAIKLPMPTPPPHRGGGFRTRHPLLGPKGSRLLGGAGRGRGAVHGGGVPRRGGGGLAAGVPVRAAVGWGGQHQTGSMMRGAGFLGAEVFRCRTMQQFFLAIVKYFLFSAILASFGHFGGYRVLLGTLAVFSASGHF